VKSIWWSFGCWFDYCTSYWNNFFYISCAIRFANEFQHFKIVKFTCKHSKYSGIVCLPYLKMIVKIKCNWVIITNIDFNYYRCQPWFLRMCHWALIQYVMWTYTLIGFIFFLRLKNVSNHPTGCQIQALNIVTVGLSDTLSLKSTFRQLSWCNDHL